MVATASQPFFGFQWVNPSVLALVIVAMAYLGVQELGSAGRPANEVALLPAWPLTRPLAVSLPAPSWPLGNLLRISEPAPVDPIETKKPDIESQTPRVGSSRAPETARTEGAKPTAEHAAADAPGRRHAARPRAPVDWPAPHRLPAPTAR